MTAVSGAGASDWPCYITGYDSAWVIWGFDTNSAVISFFVIGTLRIADNLIANAIISCYKSANIVFIGPDVTGKNRGE